jgi:hypothetical protein
LRRVSLADEDVTTTNVRAEVVRRIKEGAKNQVVKEVGE